jgi:putative ABC transport system substrate-binding protein
MILRRALITAGFGLLVSQVAAQASDPPLVGALLVGARPEWSFTWKSLVANMRKQGYVEGETVRYAARAGEDPSHLAALAAEIFALSPRVLFANGDDAARAAAAQSAIIPIVAHTDDHIAAGLSDSYARPSRNVTGISRLEGELDTKRLDVLHELVPDARVILVLRDPQTAGPERISALEGAATRLGIELATHDVRRSGDIVDAITAGVTEGARAVLVLGSPLLTAREFETSIRVAANQRRLPTMVQRPLDVAKGNLAAYGVDELATHRRIVYMIDQILKGAKPADLPIEQPTKFSFVVNLSVARALGLSVPATLLARADELIE